MTEPQCPSCGSIRLARSYTEIRCLDCTYKLVKIIVDSGKVETLHNIGEIVVI